MSFHTVWEIGNEINNVSYIRRRAYPSSNKNPRASLARGFFLPLIRCRYYFIFGPASITSCGHPSSNFLKFSINRDASCLYFARWSSLLGHEPAGSSTLAGTPSQLVGTSKPKIGSLENFAFCSSPVRAALRSARVCPMLILFPIPNGPPIHPVLTSQHVTPCFNIFRFNRSA